MNHPMKQKRTLNRLLSSMPSCVGPTVYTSRSVLAFGKWALPKLKRELRDPDIGVVRKAVFSVSDIVHDPEVTAQAIHHGVITEIQDLCRSDDELVRQGCALILKTIAGQPLGREAVLENPIAVHNLSLLVEDSRPIVRLKASLAVARLAKVWMGAESLNEAGFLPILIKRLLKEGPDTVSVHLETLKTLLDRDVKDQALELGAMQTFAPLVLHERDDISSRAESCMALLAENHHGKFLAIDMDLLPLLKEKLNDENPAIHTKAAAVIMFLTVTTPSKNQALELGLIDRLLDLAHRSENQGLQINCIKALTNIAEAPAGKLKLLNKYENTVKSIPIIKNASYRSIRHHVETLLTVMKWKP